MEELFEMLNDLPTHELLIIQKIIIHNASVTNEMIVQILNDRERGWKES